MFSKRQNSTPSMQGLNISQVQKSDMPKNLKHEILTIPAPSQFQWGSVSNLDFKEKNCKVHELVIAFNTSSVSGLSGGPITNYPNLNPTWFWINRIEIVINNVIVDTVYDLEEFILNQLMYEDEDRMLNNYSAGMYSSLAHRNSLSTTTSNWYLPIKCLFNQTHFNLLTQNHEIQLRCYMNNLSNVCNQSSLTGTPAVSINSVNLIARITRLDSEMVNASLQQIARVPRHYLFYETRYATFNVSAGVSSTTLVLTQIVGKVSQFYFVIRPIASITGNNAFSFTPITSFNILSSGGESMIGGVPIASAFNQLVQSRWWSKSSYNADALNGTSNSYVYTYSFSADPYRAYESGQNFTTKNFIGAEQLIINFTSALGAGVQIDLYALMESAIEQGVNTVKKINV